MIGNSVADAKRMFKHACAFAGCAKFCEHEPWNIECRLPDYAVAGIVNSAFACEVFLKSILVYHGMSIEEINGHRLKSLWELVQKKDPNICVGVKHKIQVLFNSDDDSKFNEMLENVSNAFANWRYIYEKSNGKIHMQFIRLFREVLKEVCCEKYYNMTWKEYTKGGEDNEIG